MSRVASEMQKQLQNQGQATQSFIKAYYCYNAEIDALASGGQGSDTVQIQADSDFLVQALSFFCVDDTTNGQITAPYTTIQVTDTGSGTTLFDQAIPILSAFGTAQLPFMLPVPRLFVANSVINVAITNVNSTNNQSYWFNFHGRKIFQLG
jgi:hypothetical protein